ncbi:pectate lyase [Streptomyces sp. NPDC006385]|uniref:pectate lyase n=1 Tax=Streptomyces sp. NPDC006385 TaxID=3156761 RepID=UPI00339E7071
MTSATRPRARTRALGGALAALGLSVGMIMTTNAPTANAATWPTPNGSEPVSKTIKISGTKDYGMKRLYGSGSLGGDGQGEDQGPILELAPGAVLKNVILGKPAADGIHCKGSCTLQNVWWEDVGEDAATFRGESASNVYTVTGGGARDASDKVFQFNGNGTLNVSNFSVKNFGTFARTCGNCSKQYKRTINLSNIEVNWKGSRIVGINTNYKDVATLRNITIVGDSGRKIIPCQKWIGNSSGDEPKENGTGPDGTYCKYSPSDITYR